LLQVLQERWGPDVFQADPFDWLRPVGSSEQLRPNAQPALTQLVLGVIDAHPIDTRTALVLANAFPRSYEILPIADIEPQPPEPAEQARWYCPETTVPEWGGLVCGKCGSRDVGFVVSGSRRDPLF
jgi:hypothetical protein